MIVMMCHAVLMMMMMMFSLGSATYAVVTLPRIRGSSYLVCSCMYRREFRGLSHEIKVRGLKFSHNYAHL